MFNIEDELKKLPERSGVYLMHDADDHIIYVGKAIILKNRVRQYFQPGYHKSPKIQRMVSQIAWFEYIVTDSETEALVLECNLIKEYRPKYNTMLTDDKAYPFVRVTVNEAFPRVMYSHRMKQDGARYFGPYTSATSVKETIKLVQKLYKLRTCSRKLPEDIGKERACLNYQIGLCNAPCRGLITPEAYNENLSKAVDLLEGHYEPIEKSIEAQMKEAAENLEFEEAANYRELLFSIRHMREAQKITDTNGENRDIVAVAIDGEEAVAQVLFVRDGKMIGRDHFHMKVADGDGQAQILNEFVKQYYAGTPFLPSEILLAEMPEEAELLSQWLSVKTGHKVGFVVPKRGEKHRLMEMAADNAALLLTQNKEKVKREEARTIGAVRQLSEMLDIPSLHRMEAYDISNTSGFQSVGSMVVFEDGRPKKNDYRKFRIKSVDGPNDYASMQEVLTRRFTHGLEEAQMMRERGVDEEYGRFTAFPDLIMMDGGKGQVHAAEEVLRSLGLDIAICGMVKDDNHRTRGLYYHDVEIDIDRHGEAFHLITRIQDEAHRFAIEYHKSLRGKAQVHSILDDIDGIGKVRRRALMRTFSTIDAMRAATVDEIAAIPEMNRSVAKIVYAFFHDGEIPD